jgi:hypothetical protein
LVKKGTRFDRTSLLTPWKDVVMVVQWYITCEGHYKVVYLQHIRLLGPPAAWKAMVNMPFFLWRMLQTMAALVQKIFSDLGNPSHTMGS